ncbi:MAG TPA: Rieske 2Fe-2S domain-containing protein [Dermatophilaceae bacterium]|nr:Rieske 2Fe-2S domain-containing protein [Dermatophilaceae bacterium]
MFPGAERTHAWSAQDYRSINRVPFVGVLPRGGKAIYVATGFNKWGMTNGVAAALNLSAQILGGTVPWAETLGRRVTTPAGVLSAIKENAGVAGEMVKDWVAAELKPLPDETPAEGEAVVGREAGRPVGVSTVAGHTSKVSAICPHLGGVLRWNNAEQTWDCPLRGSRFNVDGTRLEGPAVDDLSQLP